MAVEGAARPRSRFFNPPTLRPSASADRHGQGGVDIGGPDAQDLPRAAPRPGPERLETLGHGLEIRPQLLHGLIAVSRFLGQRLTNDLLQPGRDVRPGFFKRVRVGMDDLMDDRLIVVAAERQLPGQHLVEDDAERPDVGARVEILAPGLLRRHVGDGPDRRLALGQRGAAPELGQPEVHDLGLAPVRDHDVGALDVPVDDALAVGLAQARGDLARRLSGPREEPGAPS